MFSSRPLSHRHLSLQQKQRSQKISLVLGFPICAHGLLNCLLSLTFWLFVVLVVFFGGLSKVVFSSWKRAFLDEHHQRLCFCLVPCLWLSLADIVVLVLSVVVAVVVFVHCIFIFFLLLLLLLLFGVLHSVFGLCNSGVLWLPFVLGFFNTYFKRVIVLVVGVIVVIMGVLLVVVDDDGMLLVEDLFMTLMVVDLVCGWFCRMICLARLSY